MKAQHLVTIAPSPLNDIFDGIPVSPVFRNLDLAHTTFQARARSRRTAELLGGRQYLVIDLVPRPCAQLRYALGVSHLRMTFLSSLNETPTEWRRSHEAEPSASWSDWEQSSTKSKLSLLLA